MMIKKYETRDIGLAGVAVLPDRMRRLRPEVVETLAVSMAVHGLMHPIVLRPSDATGYYLIAGRHRFEAARNLGWKTIPARIVEVDDADEILLAEIDENLIRADLSPAERAAHQAKRKGIYERLYPLTKHGATLKRGRLPCRKNCDTGADRYTKDAAKKTGQSERLVQLEVKRGEAITGVASVAGTSLDKGDELDALSKLSKARQSELITRAAAGEKVSAKALAKQERRTERETTLGANQNALPNKKYGVILADPEWRFEPWSRLTGMSRAADNHYPTSCTEVIAARDVPSIAADDCVLFLWATIPMLPHALTVMAAWDFDYKSHYVWTKDKIGHGYWSRERHEILLIGTRGQIPCPAMGLQWDSVISAPRRGHSQKPECVLEMIEEYFPTLPKIELNRRGPARPGWDAWGNEADRPPHDPVIGESPRSAPL